jgi:glutamate dehydrogenase
MKRMATARPQTKSKPKPGNDALVSALAKAMKASLLPGDTHLSAERLHGAASFLFETAHKRKSGEPNIAIHTAADGHRYSALALVNDDMPFLVDSVAATTAMPRASSPPSVPAAPRSNR